MGLPTGFAGSGSLGGGGGMYLLGDNLALLMVTNYTISLDTQAIKLGTIKKG